MLTQQTRLLRNKVSVTCKFNDNISHSAGVVLFYDFENILVFSVASDDRRSIGQKSETVIRGIDADYGECSALEQESYCELTEQSESVNHCALAPFDL